MCLSVWGSEPPTASDLQLPSMICVTDYTSLFVFSEYFWESMGSKSHLCQQITSQGLYILEQRMWRHLVNSTFLREGKVSVCLGVLEKNGWSFEGEERSIGADNWQITGEAVEKKHKSLQAQNLGCKMREKVIT